MYVRLRVHAVQWALLLRLEVDNTSPSLALIQTWRVRPLISSYQVRSCSNFGLTILSDELTAGHSNIYEENITPVYVYLYNIVYTYICIYIHTARVSWIVSDVWLLLLYFVLLPLSP